MTGLGSSFKCLSYLLQSSWRTLEWQGKGEHQATGPNPLGLPWLLKEGSEVMPGSHLLAVHDKGSQEGGEKSQAGSGGTGGWGWKSREPKDKGRKECGIGEMRKGVGFSENKGEQGMGTKWGQEQLKRGVLTAI